MTTLDLDQAFAEAPPELFELRREVSGVLASAHDPSMIQDPTIQGVVTNYADVVGNLWGDFAERETQDRLGEDIESVPRMAIFDVCGPLIQHVARVESEEITRLIDHSPLLTRRQRLTRMARGIFGVGPEVEETTGGAALRDFVIELNCQELGSITNPEAVRKVVKRTAQRFITNQVAALDEKQILAA